MTFERNLQRILTKGAETQLIVTEQIQIEGFQKGGYSDEKVGNF